MTISSEMSLWHQQYHCKSLSFRHFFPFSNKRDSGTNIAECDQTVELVDKYRRANGYEKQMSRYACFLHYQNAHNQLHIRKGVTFLVPELLRSHLNTFPFIVQIINVLRLILYISEYFSVLTCCCLNLNTLRTHLPESESVKDASLTIAYNWTKVFHHVGAYHLCVTSLLHLSTNRSTWGCWRMDWLICELNGCCHKFLLKRIQKYFRPRYFHEKGGRSLNIPIIIKVEET